MANPPDPSQSQQQDAPLPINVPVEIGGYRIQRVLGSGGMATVYAALQTQPRRTVALKVMKAGISMKRGDAAHRRFTREIEILGKLRHPYIAQVYGAGTHDDGSGTGWTTPYFVMEYVPGAKTITEYIAAKQLDIRERLKLFVKVCAAIEHGHRRKIIHRDLKPANILIDENGDPKIIDFGVAHAAELDIASQTMHTEAGRLVGTLQYMSPEQLDASLQDLDARCDVYALGVLLYKLITGKPPHDLEASPVYEAVRIVREESPKKPSEVKPDIFRGELGGRGADLETIIMKAMESDRSRRYRNAGSLGRDIVRFLADKPINARRASLFYRTGLFVRRHRAVVIASMIVAAVVLIAAAVVTNERMNRARSMNVAATTPSSALSPSSPVEPPTTTSQADSNNAAQSAPPPVGPITLVQHTGTITKLAFSPDGSRLVSAAFDRSVGVWDLANNQLAIGHHDFDLVVRHLALSADGSRLACAGNDRSVVITDPLSGSFSVRHIDGGAVRSLALDRAGDRIAIGLENLTLRVASIVDVNDSNALTLRSVSGAFTCSAFCGDHAWLAAGSESGSVYVWNLADGSLLARFDDLRKKVVAVQFCGEPITSAASDSATDSHMRVVAIAEDGAALSWPLSANDSTPKTAFPTGRSPIVDASFAPSHRWLICATANEISLWNVQTIPPTQIGEAIKSEDTIFAVAVNPAGDRAAVGRANGDINLIPLPVPQP